MDSIHQNQTWEMVELPAGRKLMPCKWVFRYKYVSDLEKPKYKARLVAKGIQTRTGRLRWDILISSQDNQPLTLTWGHVSSKSIYNTMSCVKFIRQWNNLLMLTSRYKSMTPSTTKIYKKIVTIFWTNESMVSTNKIDLCKKWFRVHIRSILFTFLMYLIYLQSTPILIFKLSLSYSSLSLFVIIISEFNY